MDIFVGGNPILATMENVTNPIYGAFQERPRLEKRERKDNKECWMSW